ncbi:hypothetical protein FO519_007770 [Halicephalobus sp. NKZ332]|nr:hypothetical protein FO519_007770 [Halicephalobus sp. NKZ332]
MGERKGQNHYYPPDFDYKKHKTLNSYHGVHALRERGKKAHLGILTIRFEMPFNVWCLGCGNHIGMGVRYNAEKKKVGNYYTTPIYEFTMKCALCPQKFTIRTDPKNFDYELVDGCRRQEKRFDSGELDNVAPVDRQESLKLDADAMYKKEHQMKDKMKQEDVVGTIEKLEWIQERLRDDYTANSFLRNQFRTEKKHLQKVKESDDKIREKLSLEIPLQPESEEDRIMAKRMLLYKNLGTGKKCVSSKQEAVDPKKRLERKLFKSGPAFFDTKNGPAFDSGRSKNAKNVATLIKHRKDEGSSSQVDKRGPPSTSKVDDSNPLKKAKIESDPSTSKISNSVQRSSLLVDYGSDSD